MNISTVSVLPDYQNEYGGGDSGVSTSDYASSGGGASDVRLIV